MIWGDAGARRPSRVWTGVTLAAAAVVLAGCASTAGVASIAQTPEASPPVIPEATPVAAPAADAMLGEQTLTGVGPRFEEKIALTVPGGTRTVRVDLTCGAESRFTAELGDAMMLGQAPLSGVCEGSRTLAWPWVAQSAPALSLWVEPDVEWTAVVTYSPEAFAQDEVLVEECAAYSQIHSQVTNADDGYGFYAAFGADEWNARLDAAARAAEVLAASSQTALADEFAAVQVVLMERSPIPGGMTEVQEYWETQRPIAEACAWNHSEIVVHAEFGG
ncbi:hypothetical protein ACIGEP_11890 [Microbacterium sp. NPDC077663]|uniref:hypothetical protein n=1 Tax=Microbacterium sp. NPDC077663 TaxID=3364189 RepID=UPI0037C585E7